jgi:hypothetical protein
MGGILTSRGSGRCVVESPSHHRALLWGQIGLSWRQKAVECSIPYSLAILSSLKTARQNKEYLKLTSTLRRLLASAKNSSENETIFAPRATDDTSVSIHSTGELHCARIIAPHSGNVSDSPVEVSLKTSWKRSRGMASYAGCDIVSARVMGK